MQQRQPRLGDVLDDYCPRERRLTNHVVVAMIGEYVKQTRCTTCDADHEYKQAKVPRLRRKTEAPAALAAQGFAAPKLHEQASAPGSDQDRVPAEPMAAAQAETPEAADIESDVDPGEPGDQDADE